MAACACGREGKAKAASTVHGNYTRGEAQVLGWELGEDSSSGSCKNNNGGEMILFEARVSEAHSVRGVAFFGVMG